MFSIPQRCVPPVGSPCRGCCAPGHGGEGRALQGAHDEPLKLEPQAPDQAPRQMVQARTRIYEAGSGFLSHLTVKIFSFNVKLRCAV
jgi:hypothetical protein